MATVLAGLRRLYDAVGHRLDVVGHRGGRSSGRRTSNVGPSNIGPSNIGPSNIGPSRGRGRSEGGQISLLILGFTVIALMLIVGGIDVTAVQLARARLLDTADGAALDASDALAPGSAYGTGLGDAVQISDASVLDAAAHYLAVQPRPHGISSWVLVNGSGSPDGQTAVIRLRGTADIPIMAPVLAAFGASVEITVESRARSGLR